MNANVPMLNEIAGNNTKEVIMVLNKTIRQQQAEIAELKHMNRNWQMSENILLLELEKLQHCELTDEEIEEIGKQYLSAHAQFIGAGECHYEGEIEFARAILRKAQEQ